jgi:sulfite exporter TauE/SafE
METRVDYGRKLVNSSIAGANRGREEFLGGEPLALFAKAAAGRALAYAAAGACLGVLGAGAAGKYNAGRRSLGFGILGTLLGFGVGFAWQSRRLAVNMGEGALRQINAARDERWWKEHPIDYA